MLSASKYERGEDSCPLPLDVPKGPPSEDRRCCRCASGVHLGVTSSQPSSPTQIGNPSLAGATRAEALEVSAGGGPVSPIPRIRPPCSPITVSSRGPREGSKAPAHHPLPPPRVNPSWLPYTLPRRGDSGIAPSLKATTFIPNIPALNPRYISSLTAHPPRAVADGASA